MGTNALITFFPDFKHQNAEQKLTYVKSLSCFLPIALYTESIAMDKARLFCGTGITFLSTSCDKTSRSPDMFCSLLTPLSCSLFNDVKWAHLKPKTFKFIPNDH